MSVRDFAERNVMEYWIVLLHQSALMFAARTTLPHLAAEVGKPRLHLGVGDAGFDLLVELVDDLDRRVARCPTPNQPLAS